MISRVDESFGRDGCLARLRHLDLSHNKIEDIEEAFFDNCRALRSLDLKYNRLQSISTGFLKLASLAHLSLFGNRITSIPFFLLDTGIERFEFEWDIMVEPLLQASPVGSGSGSQDATRPRKRGS